MLTNKRKPLNLVIKALTNTLLMTPVILSTNAAEEPHSKGFQLEEVVVTARKREESLQDAPLAVSAFSADEMRIRQISSSDQLADITPNLTFDAFAPSSGTGSSSMIFIRGIGQTDFSAVTDPGVGLYIDGVYLSRSIGGSLDFLELERIEVLKGPQGTLFGRNTIGGAVLLYTMKPASELSGNVEIEVGSDQMSNVTANLNLPLTENLLSKFSLTSRNRDGYVKRVYGGSDLGEDDVWAGRMALQWNPSDTLEFYFTGDYTQERENGVPMVSLGINDQQTFAHIANAFDIPGCFLRPPPAPPGPGRDTGNDPNCANNTAFLGRHRNGETLNTKSDLDHWGVSLSATWEVNDWLSVKSITSYRDIDADIVSAGDQSPWVIFHREDQFEHDQFSQELQFSGVTMNDSVKWLLGLYYFEEQADNPNPVFFPSFIGNFLSGGTTDNDNFATFGQVTWDVTDRLHITAGLRYTDETKRFDPYSFIPADTTYFNPADGRLVPGDRLVPAGEVELTFDDWTPMLNIAYDLNDDVMIYVSYSEGFKSGGFDQRYNQIFPAVSSFDPEQATTWEAGMKSSWLDNRLRLNTAVFFTDYEDLHLIIREGFAPITFNGGEAEISGFEIETSFVPTDSWLLQFSVGYIDAEYTKLSQEVLAKSPIRKDFTLAQTPEWSASAGIAYTTEIKGWGTLTPRIDWVYKSEVYNDTINTPQLKADSYELINLAIAFQSVDESWDVVLAGRNLTDEEYLIAGNSAFDTGASYIEGVFDRGTQWTLSVKYNF
ncbi:MAG: TonB-dependent receptor [Pseudomonadales bacterium]|nr:TonB-dependent receptor [Pseudomonadales bacterium]MCP5215305.1 TonB-dependent receptor [Pseudomonadales bacterium]